MKDINQQTDKILKERIEFEYSILLRNFEIDLFWKRSWFFGALILAEVAAFYTLKTGGYSFIPPVIVGYIISLTTLAQCLMNRGSKYWQERWEYMTMNRESTLNIELTRLKQFTGPDIDSWFLRNYDEECGKEWFFIDASILSKGDNFFTRSRRFSVSKITFLVWDIIFICSILCWMNETYKLLSLNVDWNFTIKVSVFYLLTMGYIFLFWKGGKVFEPYEKKMEEMCKKNLGEFSKMYIDDEIYNNHFKNRK